LLKDNNRILVGFSNLSLTLYSLDEHKSENDFYGHNGAIVDCYAFSEDDKKILSASNDCTLRMWECKDVEGTNKWCFTRSIIGAETPLSVAYSEMNDVRNISEDNFKVFEQRYAKITANRSNV
jgi:WD40 repeat protein